MSDIFDDDLIYIQKGGILGMREIRALYGSWNQYLNTLKLPTTNITQELAMEQLPKKFHWRKVVSKTAGGVDEVAVQFISQEDPRFKWTTPPIKVQRKRQRALQLAMPSREHERRPTGLEYMRHLRMTAPTFLRETPRDISRAETHARFSAVYGEEELKQDEGDPEQISRVDIKPVITPHSLLTPPDLIQIMEKHEERVLGTHADKFLPRTKGSIKGSTLESYDEDKYLFSGAGAYVVGDIIHHKSKSPHFLNQRWYYILGKEEFGGKLYPTRKQAEKAQGLIKHKRVLKWALERKLRNMSLDDRHIWTKGLRRYNPVSDFLERPDYPLNRSYSYSFEVLNRPPFFVIGGVYGMMLRHLEGFNIGHDHIGVGFQTEGLEATNKWDEARWIAEFLFLKKEKQLEYFDWFELNLNVNKNDPASDQRRVWTQPDFYAPEEKIFIKDYDKGDEWEENADKITNRLENLLGLTLINREGEGDEERVLEGYRGRGDSTKNYVLTKMSWAETTPFDFWNWWSYGSWRWNKGEDAGEGLVYPVGNTGMWSIRGLNPKYLFRTKSEAYFFRGFKHISKVPDEALAPVGWGQFLGGNPINRIKRRICWHKMRKPNEDDTEDYRQMFQEMVEHQSRPDPINTDCNRIDYDIDEGDTYFFVNFCCGLTGEEDDFIRRLLGGVDIAQFEPDTTHEQEEKVENLAFYYGLRPVGEERELKGRFRFNLWDTPAENYFSKST